jgi:hypothetical protein
MPSGPTFQAEFSEQPVRIDALNIKTRTRRRPGGFFIDGRVTSPLFHHETLTGKSEEE